MRNEKNIIESGISATDLELWSGYVDLLNHLINNDILEVCFRHEEKSLMAPIVAVKLSVVVRDKKLLKKIFIELASNEESKDEQ